MPRGTELAARVRAARAWADLDRKPFGEAIGVSERQVTRYEAGTATPDLEMRQTIAAACGVPPAFMEVGFAPIARPISDSDARIHELERRLRELEQARATAGYELLAPELLAAAQALLRAQEEGDSGAAG